MTDNRTTELLCKLLEEHGIEYTKSQDRFRTRFRFNYCETCGDYLNEIEVMGACITASKSYLTPEQAIAATLGSDDEYEAKMDELLCRLTNGKWSKSRAYDLDFMESCINEEFENLHANELADATLGNGTLTAEQVREAVEKHWHDLPDEYDMPEATALPEYSYDWQAIADELNAEVGGTCKLEKVKDYKQGIVITAWGTLCSECGTFYEFIDGRSWNCCPMCMRKAVKR